MCRPLLTPCSWSSALGGMLLSSHILWPQGFIHSLGFHHCVCVVTLRPPQFFALYCSLVSSIDWLSHVYLKGALTVRGLNIPPFLQSAPFLPSSESILSSGEGWCSRMRQTWILILADIWSWTNRLILQPRVFLFKNGDKNSTCLRKFLGGRPWCTCLVPGS